MSTKAEGGMQNAEWANNFAIAHATLRNANGAYHARIHGKTASSTCSEQVAVRRAAVKWFARVAGNQGVRAPEENEITVEEISGVWLAQVKGAKR